MTDICETKTRLYSVCHFNYSFSAVTITEQAKEKIVNLRKMHLLLPPQTNAELISILTACNRNKLHMDRPTPL